MSCLSPLAYRYVRFCTTLAFCLAASTSAPAPAHELIVSAAGSLSDAFREIGRSFEAAKPGTKVVFNFAASGPLLQQIAQGAPVDVLATADQETMERAQSQALIAADSRATFAANVLVLVVPAAATAAPKSLAGLVAPGFRRIAIGNPASVPVGRYAREALDAAGLGDALRDKLIYAESVRQVLAYVARAEVDAGFTYRTDAMIDSAKVKVALELPTRTPVTYSIAAVSASKQPARAREFVAYVLSAPARAILARFGFVGS